MGVMTQGTQSGDAEYDLGSCEAVGVFGVQIAVWKVPGRVWGWCFLGVGWAVRCGRGQNWCSVAAWYRPCGTAGDLQGMAGGRRLCC